MRDDLNIAASCDKLDIPRIQARRIPCLRDAHAVFTRRLMAPEFKSAAHGLRLPVDGHAQHAAAVADPDVLPPRKRPIGIAADRIAARDGQIHRRQVRYR